MLPVRTVLGVMVLLVGLLFAPVQSLQTETGTRYDGLHFPPLVNGNYTISGDDSWVMGGNVTVIGNIVLVDNASLAVTGANLVINGTIWSRDNSSIDLSNSKVHANLPFPPPLPANVVYESPNGFFLVGKGSRMNITDCTVSFYREFRVIDLPEGTMIAAESIVSFGDLNITSSVIDTPLTVHLLTSSRTWVTGSWVSNFGLEVDAFIELRRCGIEGLNILNDRGGPCYMSNCTVDGVVAISHGTRFFMEFCTVNNLAVDTEAFVNAFGCTINSTEARDNATLVLDLSNILAPGYPYPRALKNATVVMTNSTRVSYFVMEDRASLHLNHSFIGYLDGSDNSAASLTAGANFTDSLLKDDATVYDNASITLRTRLNGIPMGAGFEAVGDPPYLTIKGNTDTTGRADVWLASRFWNASGLTECSGYNVSVGYRSWNEKKAFRVGVDTEVSFLFTDRSSPSISSVESRDDLLGGKQALTVTSKVTDEGYGVTNVTLWYRIDEAGWMQKPMSALGDGMFAATFPMDSRAGRREAQFYISASDGAGNGAETVPGSHVTGQYTAPVMLLLTVIAISVVAAAAYRVMKRRRKLGRYLRKGEGRTDGTSDEEGKRVDGE